ncbi:conserved hypothetical protein [Theileria orientalis strain Shintoku]|uniref:Uncharacterized protein n=1 Tax=Theileria orientalis strain Shintoku TaxID=869250 RepID=J4D660_THEOR|nr:conserved hypothetical protein [Theileria orientalis strain Shintoku]PVC54833.1 hypothetical protein MACL_00003555 [Theileria orientalis]BAM39360.1 conserved hypothetical protein [Theileria orientalis strain Shintoku]|eukprot:XP_009689661.1 conserved hypothetical protein [Theileria orientalis strain Shintoku]
MYLSQTLFSNARLKYAARFLKPPGFFKRAEMREKPHRKTGPFENQVKRFVRLREKARLFSQLPAPRHVPVPKPIEHTFLKPLEYVPKVPPEALERRLEFLLGDKAKQQQLHAKMREGLTPYLAELYMWERQMRDLRKIYRAQYFQKLNEVTEEERLRQYNLFMKESKDKYMKREEIRRSIYEEKKRRAILRDTMAIEKKVTQSLELGRLSSKKIKNIYWLNKLQSAINYEEDAKVEIKDINVPKLAKELGHPVEDPKKMRHKIMDGNLLFRDILKESFELMPEDAYRFEALEEETYTPEEIAKITYGVLTEEEKLELLDKKIAILNEKIDEDSKLHGKSKNNLYIQLREHMEAAKLAYLVRSINKTRY